MNISLADLKREYLRFGAARRLAVRRDLKKSGHHPHVDVALCLAIFSRETNMTNIVGDGGHGRGIAQIDDRWNPGSLRAARGCRPGSYLPVFPTALPAGRVPTLLAGVREIVREIEGGVATAKRIGVPEGHRLKFACSAYNGGQGGAEQGWRNHGESDRFTTGGDYGADVLERRRIIEGWL